MTIEITGQVNDIEIRGGGTPTPAVIIRSSTPQDTQAIERLVRLSCKHENVVYAPIPEVVYPSALRTQIFVAERDRAVIGLASSCHSETTACRSRASL